MGVDGREWRDYIGGVIETAEPDRTSAAPILRREQMKQTIETIASAVLPTLVGLAIIAALAVAVSTTSVPI